MRNIVKVYPNGVVANDGVSLSIDMDKLNKTLKMDQTKVNAIMMVNKYKEKEMQPDYKISVRTEEE